MTPRKPQNEKSSRRFSRIGSAVFMALFLSAGVMACGGDHDDGEHDEAGTPTGTACPTQQTLTYANFGQAFIQSYCIRCHSSNVQGAARFGAPTDHNFDLVTQIRALATHIDREAGSGPLATNVLMPEGGATPTTEERRKLAEWLSCGAP